MNLQNKLLAILLPIAAITCALILFLASRAVDHVLVEGATARVRAAIHDTASSIAGGIEKNDETVLLPLLNTARSQSRAIFAIAMDTTGKAVAHTNVLERGKSFPIDNPEGNSPGNKNGYRIAKNYGKDIIEVDFPVWSNEEEFLLSLEQRGRKRLGTLRLGVPLQDDREAKNRILRRIATILTASGCIALLAILLLLRSILSPIRSLAAFSKLIALGNYGESLPVLSTDELGDLTKNFNKMSSALAETTVSKDYLDGVQRSILDILIVTDKNGRIRMANAAARETLGYTEEDFKGMPALTLLGARALEGSLFGGSPLEILNTRGSLVDAELELFEKSSKKMPVLLSGSALRNRAGEIEGFVLVAKNLSERKKLEGMLRQSEKLSAVGQLAAGVAHEINNPLGIILGFAQSAGRRLAQEDPLGLPIRSIEREALRCKNLVQNLLTFSRQGRAQMEKFEFTVAVRDALSIIEAQARVKGVEIECDLKKTETILGDRGQIQQILINLCGNAIDAMPDGGRIIVRTSLHIESGRTWARLAIKDNGTGIPEDIQDEIFNPFFTTKEVGKGTGLGLSLVHEIVQRHDGTIEFESKLGQGTTFTINIPIIGQRAQDPE